MLQLEFVLAWLRTRIRDERAASLVEYAFLVALIAIVCIVAITFLGNSTDSKYSQIGSGINKA